MSNVKEMLIESKKISEKLSSKSWKKEKEDNEKQITILTNAVKVEEEQTIEFESLKNRVAALELVEKFIGTLKDKTKVIHVDGVESELSVTIIVKVLDFDDKGVSAPIYYLVNKVTNELYDEAFNLIEF